MIDCKVKLCGLRREEDICCVNAYLPDYIGFVFYPKSKRYVTGEQAQKLKEKLDPCIRAVGVFVNADPDEVTARAGERRGTQEDPGTDGKACDPRGKGNRRNESA